MKSNINLPFIYRSLIIWMLFSSCSSAPDWVQNGEVYTAGALHALMQNNLEGNIGLDSLEGISGLYGLGAMKDLNGEVLIHDGKVKIAQVNGPSTTQIDPNQDEASMLVLAYVNSWKGFKTGEITTSKELEQLLAEKAQELGLPGQGPFPFLLSGKVQNLNWHVISWDLSDSEHTHAKHQNAGLKGNLKEEDVEILGFYSMKHKGVFTHMGQKIHMHFETFNKKLLGHVDGVLLGNDMTLYLPEGFVSQEP